jgi:hypothetical protein
VRRISIDLLVHKTAFALAIPTHEEEEEEEADSQVKESYKDNLYIMRS